VEEERRKALTIHFNDGSSTTFDFPQQLDEFSNITQRIESLFKLQYLMIEAEGALLLFPLYNIRSIQVYPPPAKLPENCIKGARIAD
jgi:hypothetical protein